VAWLCSAATRTRGREDDLGCAWHPLVSIPAVGRPDHHAAERRILDVLETVAIAALHRAHDDDHRLNAVLETIRQEIKYPLVRPVVSGLSQRYFCIHPELNLLCVPLTEGQFLLHLPDLYHELGHPLLTVGNDPVVEPFHRAYLDALTEVLTYIGSEKVKESRRRGPDHPRFLLNQWESTWIRFWLTEFFCDLFAVYVVGPAFAWAHLHLFAKRGGDAYDVPMTGVSTHPADAARMLTLKEQEEAPTVSLIDVRCGNDVRDTSQRETQIDNAKYDRSQARGARVLYPNPTRNLSGHETPANYGAERQAPDILQVLPGINVVPQQCDDAEQHRRRAKDDPSVQRRLHTEKATLSLLPACRTSEVISALCSAQCRRNAACTNSLTSQ
jgi:hypothetical protein